MQRGSVAQPVDSKSSCAPHGLHTDGFLHRRQIVGHLIRTRMTIFIAREREPADDTVACRTAQFHRLPPCGPASLTGGCRIDDHEVFLWLKPGGPERGGCRQSGMPGANDDDATVR